ncbi:MAG TPA: citrate lyase holo-[acyl-carrier protein] synthase, partial [Lactobacillus sp.]|nr:citrate lyase holo-[acyl-carrier protein] synthase [Lactobacillus sp.]
MPENIFLNGTAQTIADVLQNKDDRVALQQNLAAKYPGRTIVALKMNIPGPIKNNEALAKLFTAGEAQWRSLMAQKQYAIIEDEHWERPTGMEAFYVVDAKADQVKRLAVSFEDDFALGRLFDADVLLTGESGLRALSRTNFAMPARTCLICGRPAKDCARSRRHSVDELQAHICPLYPS